MILADELCKLSSVTLRVNQIASVSIFHNYYLFFKITEVGGCLVCRFEVLQITIPIGSRTATVNQKVGTAHKTPTRRHQELGEVAHFIGCSGTTGWHSLNHFQIAFFARAMQFIIGQWRDDNAW